jgi:hypothetical protein
VCATITSYVSPLNSSEILQNLRVRMGISSAQEAQERGASAVEGGRKGDARMIDLILRSERMMAAISSTCSSSGQRERLCVRVRVRVPACPCTRPRCQQRVECAHKRKQVQAHCRSKFVIPCLEGVVWCHEKIYAMSPTFRYQFTNLYPHERMHA